jgi:hypothetical protein
MNRFSSLASLSGLVCLGLMAVPQHTCFETIFGLVCLR